MNSDAPAGRDHSAVNSIFRALEKAVPGAPTGMAGVPHPLLPVGALIAARASARCPLPADAPLKALTR
jgi:hypothetical protein